MTSFPCRQGVKRQFLLTNRKLIYAFTRRGKKFVNCPTVTDVTDTIACKRVDDLDTVTLGTSKLVEKDKIKLVGEPCQWVDLLKAITIEECEIKIAWTCVG